MTYNPKNQLLIHVCDDISFPPVFSPVNPKEISQ